jgi:hypothetical protein
VINPILEYAAQHPGQVAGAVATLGAAGFHTFKTGRIPLGRLPWRAARDIVQELREQYYGKPRPTGVAAVVVDAKPAAVKTALRDVHFEGVDLSYDRQELWDLRRPAGTKRHPETGREIPMELHVRAYETADGRTLLLAHYEASRYEAPGVHKRGEMVSWDVGQGMLASTLHSETDLEHEKIASERDAGIEVTSG